MKFPPTPKLLAIGQLNDKSQLVIPKDAREAIGVGPGDRVVIALAPFAKALVITKSEHLEQHLKDLVAASEESAQELKAALDTIKQSEDQ